MDDEKAFEKWKKSEPHYPNASLAGNWPMLAFYAGRRSKDDLEKLIEACRNYPFMAKTESYFTLSQTYKGEVTEHGTSLGNKEIIWTATLLWTHEDGGRYRFETEADGKTAKEAVQNILKKILKKR